MGNLVFEILPGHLGPFLALRKLANFQDRRFETRDFFFCFLKMLPECCRKILIYVKNYADFDGEGIIAIRCLFSANSIFCFIKNQVEEFLYLGSTMSNTGSSEKDIRPRIMYHVQIS